MEELIKELKELELLIMQCMKCGTCQAHCPLYQKDLMEASVARGKIMLIESVYEGRIEEAGKILKHIDYCLLCGRCKHNCPSGVKTDEIFLRAKSVLRKIEKMPNWQKAVLKIVMDKPEMMAKMAPLMHMGLKFGTKKIKDGVFKPLFGSFAKRNVIGIQKKAFCSEYGGFHKAENEIMKVIFYPGCATNMMFTDWGKALIKVLNHFNVSVYVPKVNKCCGIPAATMGDSQLYSKMVDQNYDIFDEFKDAKYVVTCCPTCQYGLDEMGKKVATKNTDKEFIDIIVFLDEVLKAEISVSYPKATSMHIPCHYEKSKINTLNSFVKEKIDSDFYTLKDQGCCGFGGTFNMKHYEDSKEIPKSKIEEVKENNIEMLLSPCPGCVMQLTDSVVSKGLNTDVTHPITIIAENLK
jgi:glycolate oxidase iron-sulfur subunit